MKEMSSLMFWRLPQWLILIGSVLYVAAYVGLIPRPHSLMSWLASRPDVAAAFHEPHFGRADALVLVFGTLFLGPLALLLTIVFLVFVMAMLGGFLLPIVRWLRLPDWLATVMVLVTVGLVAYTAREAWVPGSLWFLGLLARACRVVLA